MLALDTSVILQPRASNGMAGESKQKHEPTAKHYPNRQQEHSRGTSTHIISKALQVSPGTPR